VWQTLLFLGLVIVAVWNKEYHKVPITEYLSVSITYVGAMFCSNLAIEYIDFPTMVLAKSCKPIPVMLMGVLVLGKKQPFLKYISVFMISIGICIFSWKSKSGDIASNTSLGIILLAASLAMDGITGPFQEKLIRKHNPTSYHMMLYCNLWASIILLIALVFTGEGYRAFDFCSRNPEILYQLATLSIAGAIGQNFIYFTIYRFGSLACSLITTTRKFFTILGSVVWFGHQLTAIQWLGVSVVFIGLGVDMINSNSKHKHKD